MGPWGREGEAWEFGLGVRAGSGYVGRWGVRGEGGERQGAAGEGVDEAGVEGGTGGRGGGWDRQGGRGRRGGGTREGLPRGKLATFRGAVEAPLKLLHCSYASQRQHKPPTRSFRQKENLTEGLLALTVVNARHQYIRTQCLDHLRAQVCRGPQVVNVHVLRPPRHVGAVVRGDGGGVGVCRAVVVVGAVVVEGALHQNGEASDVVNETVPGGVQWWVELDRSCVCVHAL